MALVYSQWSRWSFMIWPWYGTTRQSSNEAILIGCVHDSIGTTSLLRHYRQERDSKYLEIWNLVLGSIVCWKDDAEESVARMKTRETLACFFWEIRKHSFFRLYTGRDELVPGYRIPSCCTTVWNFWQCRGRGYETFFRFVANVATKHYSYPRGWVNLPPPPKNCRNFKNNAPFFDTFFEFFAIRAFLERKF